MTDWILNQVNRIAFVMIDAAGTEVPGLGNGFTLEISKNNGAFVGSTGTKAEIGNGWYTYLATAAEASTLGTVNIKVTGAGCVQQNLEYIVKQRTPGAYAYTYTVTNSLTLLPQAGIKVWITTDGAGTNIIWNGYTDAFGVARDGDSYLPYLDAGLYYFFKQAPAFTAITNALTVSAGSTSGSGTVTPIASAPAAPSIPTFPLPFDSSCISLNRYTYLIQQAECAFWGVNDPDNPEPGCRTIWTEMQRAEVARYLAEAQEEIEQQIGFTLCPTWHTEENHNYTCPVQTNWGKVIAGGVRGETTILAGAAVNYATEPATVGPIATTVTDKAELHVYYPGSEREIEPKYINLAGGFATFYIPRCRMVTSNLVDNPEEGLDYNDLTNFLDSVDVKRIYNDTSVNAELVWPHQCSAICASSGCSEYTQDGCIYVRKPEIGSVDVTPATYSGGTWTPTRTLCCRGTPQFVRLNYYAGAATVTRQAEDAILRLAHSKMPDEFCGCETWQRLWRRDRDISPIATREMLNCPFGQNRGALIAWAFVRQFKLVRGDTL